MKTIAIVTGATSGVGREFVRQIDGRCYGHLDEIWVVARDAERLAELENRTYAHVRAFALDLSRPQGAQPLLDALAEQDEVCVRWLVNSAGFGRFEDFAALSGETVRAMVELNCVAVADLVSGALPYMGPGSHIVNMSSVAAYLPLPSLGLYAATKRFVLDLTHTLNSELRGTGITACAVCPKALQTHFWDQAGSRSNLGFVFGTEKVFDVVRKAMTAAEAGRGSIITAPEMKVVCGMFKVLPYGVGEALCRLRAAALDVHTQNTTPVV